MLVDTLEFMGYSVSIPSNQSTLEVALVWEAHQSYGKDYLTNVRLLDQPGRVVSSWVSHAAIGLYPTRVWSPGEVIYDQVKLPLFNLSPGTYTLQAFLLEAYRRPPVKATGPLFSIVANALENAILLTSFEPAKILQ